MWTWWKDFKMLVKESQCQMSHCFRQVLGSSSVSRVVTVREGHCYIFFKCSAKEIILQFCKFEQFWMLIIKVLQKRGHLSPMSLPDMSICFFFFESSQTSEFCHHPLSNAPQLKHPMWERHYMQGSGFNLDDKPHCRDFLLHFGHEASVWPNNGVGWVSSLKLLRELRSEICVAVLPSWSFSMGTSCCEETVVTAHPPCCLWQQTVLWKVMGNK